ncbi:hypothetical protein OHA25_56745 [Nonomuraea sp. NBC_00507]
MLSAQPATVNQPQEGPRDSPGSFALYGTASGKPHRCAHRVWPRSGPYSPPCSSTPESDENCYTDSTAISAEARSNRRILGNALASAGFVNYPTEWSHWSFGER